MYSFISKDKLNGQKTFLQEKGNICKLNMVRFCGYLDKDDSEREKLNLKDFSKCRKVKKIESTCSTSQ